MTARTPRLVPAESWEHPVPGLLYAQERPAPGSLAFSLMRRVPCSFFVAEVVPGRNYWVVSLQNDNWGLHGTSDELTTWYVLPIPRKPKTPWGPQELAVACAKRLSEYRGWVRLQRFANNVCDFAANFVSNTMWTFCVWSTDQVLCPVVQPYPAGTVFHPSGMVVFPEGLARSHTSPHHAAPKAKDAAFCKLAQRLLP